MSPALHHAATDHLSETTLRAAHTQLSRQRPQKKRTDPEALWITARLAALTSAIRGRLPGQRPTSGRSGE